MADEAIHTFFNSYIKLLNIDWAVWNNILLYGKAASRLNCLW